MDLTTRKVTRDGKYVHLGPTEFRLLRFFMDVITSYSIHYTKLYDPDGYNKLKDLPITQNDMTYIRGVRDGYPIDVVKGLYDPLNKEDGKAQKWEKLLDFAKNGKQVEAQTKLKKLSNTSVKPPKLKSKACGVGSKA